MYEALFGYARLKELLFNADGEAVKRVACVDWFLFTGKRTELVLFI